jgi:hypothetical protein
MREQLKQMVKKMMPLAALVVAGGAMAGLLFGDGCGPVERTVRAALGTWDMWQTPAVHPHERPLRSVPDGAVPVDAPADEIAAAARELEALSPIERTERGRLAWRRYCHHCHGENGDNRVIAGESFGFALPDLREEEILEMEDEDLFGIISEGSGRMIALAATLTPLERLLAVHHLRTLADNPSRPFYPPRWVRPAQEPVAR